MTKKSKLKKRREEILPPETPAISLPNLNQNNNNNNNNSSKINKNQTEAQNDTMTDARKKEELRNKLFKSRHKSNSTNNNNSLDESLNTNQSIFSKGDPSTKLKEDFRKKTTKEEVSTKEENSIKVTSLNGGNTFFIDSTSNSKTNNGNCTKDSNILQEFGKGFGGQNEKNRNFGEKPFLTYDLFQRSLQEEITNRENAKTFSFNNNFAGIRRQNGKLSGGEEEDAEEILGLDIGHDNDVKFSTNPMTPGQRYQLYPDPSVFIHNSCRSETGQRSTGQSGQRSTGQSGQRSTGQSGQRSLGQLGQPGQRSPEEKETTSAAIIQRDYPPEPGLTEGSKVTGSALTAGSVPGSYNFFRKNNTGPSTGLAACRSVWDGTLCGIKTCSQPASKKCKNCKAAFYCSVEHQRADWKAHKHSCIPYKMDFIDDARSAMVAVRNIPAGRLIFAEKPFLVFPIASFDTDFMHVMELNCIIREDYLHTCGAKSPACLGCMKCVELLGTQRHHCSRCGLPLCSKKCEYEIAHQLGECAVIENSGGLTAEERPQGCFHSLYMDVEILRALHLAQYDPLQWEKFMELKHHVRVEVYKRSARFDLFVRNTKRLVPYSAKASGYNFDLIRDVHAIITALSFKPSLKSPYKMLISTQLYFAHDCLPNTLQYVEHQVTGTAQKMRCVVKAAVTILKGEIISLDFVPTPYLAYSLRRRVLENLCLNCTCKRCVTPSRVGDHSGDVICPNCRRGLVRPETALQWKDSVWSCDRCQEEVPYAQIKESYSELRSQLHSIPKTREGLERLRAFIQRAEEILNPTHELVIMAWCFVETIIRPNLESLRFPDPFKVLPDSALQDYTLLAQYCQTCEGHFKALRPGFWLDLGVVQFQKFYASFALAAREFQESHLQRKDFIIQVLRAMKNLQEAVVILQAYDGYNATESVSRLTQDATWTLSTIKSVMDNLMKQEKASQSSQPPIS